MRRERQRLLDCARMVRLRQALPYIFAGFDISIVLCVIGAIVGEFVGAQAGVGILILQKNLNFDIAGTFALLIVLSLVGVGLPTVVNAIQRRVVFWVDLVVIRFAPPEAALTRPGEPAAPMGRPRSPKWVRQTQEMYAAVAP